MEGPAATDFVSTIERPTPTDILDRGGRLAISVLLEPSLVSVDFSEGLELDETALALDV